MQPGKNQLTQRSSEYSVIKEIQSDIVRERKDGPETNSLASSNILSEAADLFQMCRSTAVMTEYYSVNSAQRTDWIQPDYRSYLHNFIIFCLIQPTYLSITARVRQSRNESDFFGRIFLWQLIRSVYLKALNCESRFRAL